MRSRYGEAAARFQERRQRERDAPRLLDDVPAILSLRLEVEERRGSATLPESKHIRHVVIDQAPALLALVCGDTSCRHGGHDLTRDMLYHLRRGELDFVIESACGGEVGTAYCSRVVRVCGSATYRPSPA
ncbi:MAG TPA: hypothetical protein VGJ84_22625 [Polyangiaceae bacterium]|jgi:hypothetical protein